jgi:hypothetical protein
MGETRVDLLHLLEDLRDAYPGALEETILTEIVANSLDSGARSIELSTDPVQATLTTVDDGAGMARHELTRYHDIAATTKARGQGIGFAGVGVKLGLLACQEVITETRRGKVHVASSWRLASRHRAPWRRVPPPGLVAQRGTAVRLRMSNPLSPLLDPSFVEATLGRAFQPLFESAFDEVLASHYPAGVRFTVNGNALPRRAARPDCAPLAIRLGRKRKPSAVGYLLGGAAPLPEGERGLAVSTLGKVIKRGWEWLGLAPATGTRVCGLIEVPPLADCLTLNKADFIRVGRRGMTYLAYRKAIQEAVAAQLAAWGDPQEPGEEGRRRKARPLERDLEGVLADLADDFPLLASLVEQRPGGQRRLAISPGRDGPPPAKVPAAVGTEARVETEGPSPEAASLEPQPAAPATAPEGARPTEARPGEAPPEPVARVILGEGVGPARRGRRQPGHYGLGVQFASRPDDPEIARLVESTVWVNEAHPAYRRAAASRSEGYHLALAVAMALAPLAAEPKDAHAFLTAFLARWGLALDRGRSGRRARRR